MCISTQYYDASVKLCVCPIASYLINSVCQYCSFANCAACNSVGCTICQSGFYPASGLCASCSSYCISCQSNSSCISCNYGYTLQNGICIDTNSICSIEVYNSTIICPPGCSQCAFSNEIIYCIFVVANYYFDSIGTIQPCQSSCLTCASTNSSICTSCFGSSLLSGGQCLECTDKFALACPGNVNYSTNCVRGYSPFNGTCQACAPFCKACGISGAGMCNANSCE